MRKKFIRFAILCICNLSMVLFLFSACASNSGTIVTLESLVSNKAISEENLKNIAALRNGSLQIVKGSEQSILDLDTIEYTIVPISEELSNDQKTTILKDFKKYVDERYQTAHVDYKVTESEIVNYFGTYNHQTIVEIKFSLSGFDFSEESSDLVISDYYFGKITENRWIIAWTAN